MVSRTLVAGLLLTAGAFAQMTSFPKPSYFRETFKRTDTKVELKPPVRINDFVVTGPECGQPAPGQPPVKCLRLSLQNYMELVMANNTTVQTDFLSVETAKNNVTSAYGAWDPSATFSLAPSWARDSSVGGTNSNSLPLNLGFSQKLSSGQTITASGGGNRTDLSTSNPSVSSNMGFSITQPLIKNRGSYINRVSLMQARTSLRISEFQLRNTLINRINSAEAAYWNVVSARENIRVAERARDIAKANRDFVQKQLSLGAVAEIDTYASETSVATREVNLSNARFALRVAEESFRQQIAADLDASTRDLQLTLTDAPDLSASERIIPDREQTVSQAFARHPALQTALQRLDADDLSLASARNGLLPQLDAKFSYSGSGAGAYSRSVLGSQRVLRDVDGSIIALPTGIDPGLSAYLMALTPSSISYGPYMPGGLGDALSQMFRFTKPTYTASLTLTLPIRSKSAAATMANALITKKSDTLAVRSQQQGIRLNVSQALTNFEGAQESLRLAEVQLQYAQKDNEATTLKYELGMVQQIDVLRANQSLADAESAVVSAKIALRNRLLALYVATGELLERRNIVIN